MRNEFTAVVERDGEWFIAYALEVPGANGQGRTRDEAIESSRQAVTLILEDRREDGLRGLPADADRETVGAAAPGDPGPSGSQDLPRPFLAGARPPVSA